MNSLVRLGVSPATATPTDFYSQRFCSFLFPCWNPGLCSLSCSPVVPPGLSTSKCGIAPSASHCLARPSPHGPPAATLLHVLSFLPNSTPPTSLSDCFFFNSLVVGLPYSSICWHFWLFFVFKFVVILLLVVRGGKSYLPLTPSWPEVRILFFNSKLYFIPPFN